MSHNLTQPEGIDRILMTMAVYEMDEDMTIPDGTQLSKGIRNAQLDEFATASGFSYGAAHKKSALSGP